MLTSPLVYIIVLTWNGKSDTLECLTSLRSLSYRKYRLLVVDNDSSDGTHEAVQDLFPDVELLKSNENRRFAGGNNLGIQLAMQRGADVCVLLNNDTIVEPDFVERMLDALMSDEAVGMVGPKIRYYDDRERIWYAGGKIEWWKGWISHVGIREVDTGQYDERRKTDYITGCCCMVRRELIERIGVLDESYHIYGEDADWSIRAKRAGFILLYEPEAVIYHKLSVSAGGHFSWFKNWNKLKSQLRLMWRYSKYYHWLTIPCMLVYEIVRSIWSMRRSILDSI